MTYENKKKFIVNVLFAITVYLILYFVFKYVIHWIMPFIVGFIIAFILKPITNAIKKLTRTTGKGVSLFVVAAFYFFILLLIWTLSTFLWSQLSDLIKVCTNLYFTNIEPLLYTLNNNIIDMVDDLSPELAETLSQIIFSGIEALTGVIRSLSVYLISFVTKTISNFPLYLISVIFTIVLSVFISLEFDGLTKFLSRQLSQNLNTTLSESKKFLVGTLFKMIKAYAIIMLITFSELFIGFKILKVEYALSISAIIAVLDILPLIGTGGIVIPWAIVQLILKNYSLGVGLLILYFIVTIVRNFIEPKIVGQQIGLHPIITITAMYAGLRLFGFAGFILAPITVILIKYLNDTGRIKLFK